jgi:flagellar basal-body rod modification protein FlgD|nr:flagellar hook capping FlgD N-terminal domain-containing protein [uncultured Romboutsia sp.]
MTSINTGTSMNDTSSLRSRTVNKTENGTTIVSGNDNSDKDLFLKLLVAQMKNQDPFNSQDPTQYITQLAQFNMLEQTMTLNENIEYMIGLTNGVLANSAVGTASNLIGKDIEAYAPIDGSQSSDDTKTISGKVESVHIKDGVVYMNVKDSKSENIIEVEYGALIKVNG